MKMQHSFGRIVHMIALVFGISTAAMSHAATVYVDAIRGFNSLDGSTNVVISSTNGPLRSIDTAISMAPSGTTVSVAAGYYTELTGATSVTWDVSIKSLSLLPQGSVWMENDFSTRGDCIPDWWKILNGLSITDPTVAGSASTNPWAHGLTNLQVYQNPSVLLGNNFSSLNDGVPDWYKISNGYSPLASIPIVATPVFSPLPVFGSNYTSAVTVWITCATSNAVVRYTTDGTDPTTSSSLVPTGNVVILGMDLTLKARAWYTAMVPSLVQCANYSINPGMIAVGSDHILAMRSDGVVWSYSTSAVMMAGLTNIIDIAASAGGHQLALTDQGNLWAWGTNTMGQLGNGTTTNSLSPDAIPGLTNIAAIATGESHSLAADNTGKAWAWGSDEFGQLGNGQTNTFSSTPITVSALSNVNIEAVAAGGAHSLGLATNGFVWAWGLNTSGQVGNGSFTNLLTPAMASGISNPVIALAAGYQHSLALDAESNLWAWGLNDRGQLGIGTTNNSSTPMLVTQPPTNIVAIATGDAHSLALDSSGTLWAWGDDTDGQLGDGTNGMQLVPEKILALTNTVVAIAASGNLSAALRVDGTIWAWGQCVGASLGDLTNDGTNIPIQLLGFNMASWIDSTGGGIPDGWEIANGLNRYDPTVPNQVSSNPWAHGLTNLQVYENPSVLISNGYSTCGDGLPDWWKLKNGSSVTNCSAFSGSPIFTVTYPTSGMTIYP